MSKRQRPSKWILGPIGRYLEMAEMYLTWEWQQKAQEAAGKSPKTVAALGFAVADRRAQQN